MGMKIRNLKFWGRLCGESLGLLLAGTIVCFLFVYVGGKEHMGEIGEMFSVSLALLAYYVLIVGSFMLLIMSISYFQVYFPLVITMNVLRKNAAIGLTGCILGTVAGILGICALIWRLTPGEIAEGGWALMPVFAGGLLLIAAFGLFMGMAVVRWRKAGIVMMSVIFGLFGAGVAIVLMNNEEVGGFFSFLSSLNEKVNLLLLVGIGIYLLVSILIVKAVRKIEVRA